MSDKNDSKPTHLRLVTPNESADEEKPHPHNSGRAPENKEPWRRLAIQEVSFVVMIIALVAFMYFMIKLILVTPIK